MTINTFVYLLSFYAVLTSLITEGLKNTIFSEIENHFYSVVALVVALLVGLIGTFVYYQLNYIPVDVNNVIFAILLSLGSGLVATTSYDKVHSLIKML